MKPFLNYLLRTLFSGIEQDSFFKISLLYVDIITHFLHFSWVNLSTLVSSFSFLLLESRVKQTPENIGVDREYKVLAVDTKEYPYKCRPPDHSLSNVRIT